jgi:hypothetical protein
VKFIGQNIIRLQNCGQNAIAPNNFVHPQLRNDKIGLSSNRVNEGY